MEKNITLGRATARGFGEASTPGFRASAGRLAGTIIKTPRIVLAIVAGLLWAGSVSAQFATNYSFASRQVIEGPGLTVTETLSRSLSNSVWQAFPRPANFPFEPALWWSWTAPGDGVANVQIVDSSAVNGIFAYTGGDVAALAPVASDSRVIAGQLNATFAASQGTTYSFAAAFSQAGGITLSLLQSPPGPPVIVTQPPANLTASVGQNILIAAGAAAVPAPGYQWIKDGATVPGGNGPSLARVHLGTGDAGAYSLVVSNTYGSVTSSVSVVTVKNGSPTVSFAGHPVEPGWTDGQGVAARFNMPQSAAFDSHQNLFVADSFNHAIRKIAPDGSATTFAGGSRGSADGAGAAARFFYPAGVAVDASDNVWVADQFNSAIRMITPSGLVSTVAGRAGIVGIADGAGTNALFNHPFGIAIDPAGNVFVADAFNFTIRKIAAGGAVTTFAGTAGKSGGTDSSEGSPLFGQPAGLATDGAGNVYVADAGYDTIRKITPAGFVTTLAGIPDQEGYYDGAGTNALFSGPEGVAVDSSGRVYVADTQNDVIRAVGPDGTVTTWAGQAGVTGGTDAAGTNALFNLPAGIVLDRFGNLFVADTWNHTIRVVSTNTVVANFAGPGGSAGSDNGTGTLAQFYLPAGAALDRAGNLYVADTLNFTIRKVTPAGAVTVYAGQAGQQGSADGPAELALFGGPSGVAVDTVGNVYVADTDNQTIRVVTTDGIVSTIAGQPGVAGATNGPALEATFNDPGAVAVDGAGNIYVADTDNEVIRLISTNGAVSTLAGNPGVAGYANGVGTNAAFSSPSALVVDGTGQIFVGDSGNESIRVIGTDGTVGLFAGTPKTVGNADGPATNATFGSPGALAIDAAGNIYVADSYNNTIRLVTAGGAVSTLAGQPVGTGSGDGIGAEAFFFAPNGIAVDPSGQIVYVVDSYNNSIRIVDPGLPSLPVLQIRFSPGQITLSWPAAAAGFQLQSSPTPSPTGPWSPVTGVPVVANGEASLALPASAGGEYFRLGAP